MVPAAAAASQPDRARPASPPTGRDRSLSSSAAIVWCFANATDKSLNYLTYSDGTWTRGQVDRADSKFTAETALAAVDKMVSSQ